MLPPRLSGYFAGRFLEIVDPRLKGSPHERLASAVRGDEVNILEVCAATGFLSRMVAARFPRARVSALDLSSELIGQGRRRAEGLPNLAFFRGDARAIPFRDSSLDLVLAAFGLSELPFGVRSECLREIDRVLTRRGRLLVVDIDDPPRHARLFHAYRYLSRRRQSGEVLGGGLTRQIESQGFRVVSHDGAQGGFLPFQVIVAHRVHSAA